MSSESKEIRSAIIFDRIVRRIAVMAVILYAAGCAGVTYLQISHL